ncbi:hypothetical protein V5O48_005295 [Marasmius crinis-equi]|uniref:Uncharacterized protein n=1 Tax=Marasmius crinis-equi TaxID=585013 RepID=A0ABR3FMR7_9AGAR
MDDREKLVLRQIEEDWDGYQSALAEENRSEPPIDDIKKGFEDVISSSSKELAHLFYSWKAALDARSDTAPHLLAVLLKGVYPKIPAYSKVYKTELKPEQHIKVSSLQDIDCKVLAKLAPAAKSYGFDMHLGQFHHEQFGLVRVDAATFWETEKYDEDPDKAEFERILDGDSDYREKLEIEHVFSLDGIPMVLDERDVEELQSIFVNGTITDRPRSNKLVDYSPFDGGPYLTRTWYRRILLLSPEGSEQVTPRTESHQWFRSELERSPSSSTPSARERRLLDALLHCLEEETSEDPDPCQPLRPKDCREFVTPVLDRALAWKDMDLLADAVYSCTRETIAIIGVDKLVATYKVFGRRVKETILQAIEMESSRGLQIQLVENLRDIAQVAQDHDFASWCGRQLDSIFGRLSKLEDGRVIPFIFESASSQQNPSLALQEMIGSRFKSIGHSDVDMWRALFEKLARMAQSTSGSSPFDRSVLEQLIRECLQRIATELSPYTELKVPSISHPACVVKHVVSFVEFCLQFHEPELPEAFFRRMKNDAAENDKNPRHHNPAHLHYSELVTEFDTLIKAKPNAQKALDMFFNDALLAMLPHSNTGSLPRLPLEVACLNLNDPSKAFEEWFTSDRVKNARKEAAVFGTARMFIKTLRAQNKPQRVLEQCFDALKPLAEVVINDFDPSGLDRRLDRQSLLDIISLYLDFDEPHFGPRSSRLLHKILNFRDTATYIDSSLVPFMTELKTALQRTNPPRSLVDQPYAEFAAGVTRKWIECNLQGRPCPEFGFAVDDLKVGCECVVCTTHLAPLFSRKQTAQKKFKLGNGISNSEKSHLEQQLGSMRRFGITYQVVSVTNPVRLTVHRPAQIGQLLEWSKKQRQPEGRRLLESLGTVEEQQKIMGPHYHWAEGTVAGARTQPVSTAGGTKRALESTVPSQEPREANPKRRRH